MGFSVQYTKDELIFIINEEVIQDSLIEKVVNQIKPKYKIGLDMKKVKALNSDLFIKYLINNKFKLYNLQNDVITYLSMILKNGNLKSYLNFEDFKNNKRELVRRRFSIV